MALDILEEETLKFLADTKGLTSTQARRYMAAYGDCRVAEVVNQLKGVYCMLPKQPTPVLAPNPVIDTIESFVTHSVDRDAMQAMNLAAIGMIERLQEMKELTALDAYSLASLAMDTRIGRPEAGASSLHCLLPKSLWVNG